MPSESEIREHKITHCPYRCWCDECVEAFGRERPHFAGRGSERCVPVVHVDYLFWTARGFVTKDDMTPDERADALTVVAAYDSSTKFIFAHPVTAKGVSEDQYAADAVAEDIGWLGYPRVLLRSDNEPALLALLKESLKCMRIQSEAAPLESVATEGSVPYDPQTNGAAETGVRLLKGQARALMLGLEKEIAMAIPPKHAMAQWVVRHAGHVRSLRIVGTDGKTAYQRVRGVANHTAMANLGEVVRYKARSQERHGIAGSGWRWSSAVWLGVDHRTNQYILYDQNFGVRMARTIMRLPQEQKFCAARVAEVDVTPQSMYRNEPREPQAVLRPRAPEAPAPQRVDPDAPRAARRMYIRQDDIIRFGFTDGCPRCQHARRYGFNQTTLQHSAACRARVEGELAKDEAGQRRLARVEQRMHEHAAEEGERILRDQQRPHASVGESGDRPRGDADSGPSDALRAPPSSSARPPASRPREPPRFLPPRFLSEREDVADGADDHRGAHLPSPERNAQYSPPRGDTPIHEPNNDENGNEPGMDLDIVDCRDVLFAAARRPRKAKGPCVAAGGALDRASDRRAERRTTSHGLSVDGGSGSQGTHGADTVSSSEPPSEKTGVGVRGPDPPVTFDRVRGEAQAQAQCDSGRESTPVAVDQGAQSSDEHECELRDIVRLYCVEMRREARQRQNEVLLAVNQMGGDGCKYRRERARAARAVISEVYSPPRVGELAGRLTKYGCAPGLAFDITTCDEHGVPWDFSLPERRAEAERRIDAERPTLLIGSPMCTAFSNWQKINDRKRPRGVVLEEKEAGKMHLAWTMHLYKERRLDTSRASRRGQLFAGTLRAGSAPAARRPAGQRRPMPTRATGRDWAPHSEAHRMHEQL